MLGLVLGNRRGRVRNFLRKFGLVVGVLALCLALIYTAFRRWTLITPPEDDGPRLPRRVQVELAGGTTRLRLGQSWIERRDGIWRLHLFGGPREMGHAHGLLAGRVTSDLDHHMLQLMDSFVTSWWRRWLVGNLVRWRFRHLPDHIPPMRVVELAAFSRTMVSSPEFPESPYHRLIYYHALHDMTQRLDGSPLVGCTALAVWGKQTAGGQLLIGRNFDFEGGSIFDREKAVLAFHTRERIPFVSVAWPGMMGVVTGVNARKIYVSINAARTDHPLQPGIPMGFLVREVLERASSIPEALKIIKRYKVMVPEALLLADGKVPRAVVVELSPGQVVVRESARGLLGVTNHFLDKRYKADASNDWLRRYTTSEARYKRLMQLLRRFGGRFDVKTVAMVMRNRTGIDDEPLGLGNRNALDALIATHGVVLNLSEMMLWVSRGPNLLGPYVAVDLRPIFGMPISAVRESASLKADPLLGSPQLARYRLARRQMAYARRLARGGHLTGAQDYAARAVALEPESAEASKLLGDLLWRAGRQEQARERYRTFLKLYPPYLKDVEQVKGRLGL
jgi:tetratricopeptide (TPR) repeat protein